MTFFYFIYFFIPRLGWDDVLVGKYILSEVRNTLVAVLAFLGKLQTAINNRLTVYGNNE